ncbi:hypothetical protein A2Z33_07610 [Candidatus Gottesmanbacteria bacterium RBG_16_52_11]|uniref:RNA polymerase sigma-70 region 2 domain-containing protein n=1 Tax=Candidatus Gottesmanbacteria bacterium RBG_16_52_11 TaxID=1798374 RepID=A0A1F5YN92_9BACT|nr:MAG: hypothetical protein A2Z33_07610 [Candidatus Gottesmanbacteria bacterium RBG_16_52_11]
MDDVKLIDGILRRDRRALARFYQAYAPRLSRLIGRKISDPHDAEEVLQDTLFAFLEGLRDFSGRSSLTTYIYAITNHKITDYYRRRKIRHTVFSRTGGLEQLISPVVSPEDEMEARLLADRIRVALSRILPRHRRLLESKYVEELPVAQIAKRLSLTLKSAESALFRARKSFVKAFVSI